MDGGAMEYRTPDLRIANEKLRVSFDVFHEAEILLYHQAEAIEIT